MFQPSLMQEAIELSRQNINDSKGGPFAAVVSRDGAIIASGTNCVTSANDPTAHAEIIAIREACRVLNSFQLVGCEIYTTCEPCPMCLGAIYWARPDKVYFANSRDDAARIGFDDLFIYEELARPLDSRRIPMVQKMRDDALTVFREWETKIDKIKY
jgi:guanine deaminase